MDEVIKDNLYLMFLIIIDRIQAKGIKASIRVRIGYSKIGKLHVVDWNIVGVRLFQYPALSDLSQVLNTARFF